MLKHLAAGSCILLLCAGVAAAQSSPLSAAAQAKRQRTDAVIGSASDKIKSLDEPTMRVFLRLRAAKFLWAEKTPEASQAAESLAVEALADLQEHADAIPGLYSNLFRRELLAALQVRAPELAARLVKKYGLESASHSFETAYELLGSADGASKAVEIMRRNIGGNARVADSSLNFFLSRLDETRPEEVNRLLADLLGAMERAPASYPVTYLFGIANKYLYREATPAELKGRFLGLLIRVSANTAALPPEEQILAYNLLRANMAAVQRLLPTLYAQAGAQVETLASMQPRQARERETPDDNIRRSSDPLEQMISEAEGAKDERLRREYLSRAAQRALDSDRLMLAVEMIMKIRTEGERDEQYFVPHRDQFLSEVVRKAVAKKDYDMASKAVSNLRDPLRRALGLQWVASSYHETGDVVRAREMLHDATKLAESADDDSRKVVALLQLAALYVRIDETRVLPTTQSAVKIINALPSPKPEEKSGAESRHKHVEMLMQLAYVLLPTFQRLSRQDEAGTFALAESIRRADLRAAAALGASMGVPVPDSGRAARPAKAN
ncbi:MAG TPA: hypothetical protein VEY11_16510 [Pyrinomonadaceae bacterium]|nr:hypothetical protein [Pyrinomonadaceae bacterium]